MEGEGKAGGPTPVDKAQAGVQVNLMRIRGIATLFLAFLNATSAENNLSVAVYRLVSVTISCNFTEEQA